MGIRDTNICVFTQKYSLFQGFLLLKIFFLKKVTWKTENEMSIYCSIPLQIQEKRMCKFWSEPDFWEFFFGNSEESLIFLRKEVNRHPCKLQWSWLDFSFNWCHSRKPSLFYFWKIKSREVSISFQHRQGTLLWPAYQI